MLDTLISYVDKFGPEVLVILFGMLIILSTLFLWLWFSNRRKYHNLKHAIPANVVKNYLDSIIQNSTALKSSLFRGGGLELDLESVPSVMPVGKLSGGESLAVSGAPATAIMEELNQKKAQLASLEAQLSSLQAAHRELEEKYSQSESKLATAEARIRELEALLAQKGDEVVAGAVAGAGEADEALKAELEEVTKERDEIRDRLKEFEIISDDLANLKRLQQENDQLKKSLAAQGGGIAAPQAEVPSEEANQREHNDVAELFEDLGNQDSSADNSALESFLSSPDESNESEKESENEQPVEAAQENQENDQESKDRTPEDLLSEFEKMLG